MQSRRPNFNLPVEIWHNCYNWTNLRMEDMVALSMTCKLFYDICRPRMFEHILYLPTTALLNERISEEDYKRWERSATHIEAKLKWLASNPVTATYPRHCLFSGIPDQDLENFSLQYPNSTNLYRSLLSTFKASLGSFTNIRYFHLEDIKVDEEIIRSLHKLPLLKQIYFQSVFLSCHSVSPLIQVVDLSILEWDVHQREFETGTLELFSNKRLESVDLQSFEYALPCLQHFISQGTSNALTTLEIALNIHILPTLFEFLETCPGLTTLGASVIVDPGDFRPTYPTLSPSALPNLHRYTGVASMAAEIVPGRPVHNLIIKDTWDGSINDARPSSVLHDLTKSSAVIKGISLPRLPPHPDIFHVISKMLPKLETVQFNFPLTEEDKEDFPNDNREPDEEYFDVTVPTEIKSIPVDENGCPVRPPTSMKGILYWLCLNKLPLPPTIRKLAFVQRNHLRGLLQLYKSCLSYREQYHILEMLSSHSPNLKCVIFGGLHVQWVLGDDGKWKPGGDYALFVENRWQIVGGRRRENAVEA